MKRKTGYNSTFAIVGFLCSADSFVVDEDPVIRINPESFRDVENRQLLVAANRYHLNSSLLQ